MSHAVNWPLKCILFALPSCVAVWLGEQILCQPVV